MKKLPVTRSMLLLTCLLAAYQVAIGIDGLEGVPITAYTIAFGVLLLAGLLIIILGMEALSSPVVVVVLTILPLSLSLGLVWEHLPAWRLPYLYFVLCGFLAIILTRAFPVPGRLPTLMLAIVHGVAGMVVFLLPSILAAQGLTRPGFALVGLGGALISIGGLLHSFLKAGWPVISRETITVLMPALLQVMTAAFVIGFALE